jgi:hypothetical protein
VAAMAVCAVVGLAAPVIAGDPAGTWRSISRINSQAIESTLKLRLDSEGPTLSGFYIDAQTNQQTAITPALFNAEDDKVSFLVTHDSNGQKFTILYSGALTGDTITGTAQFERGGRVQTGEWSATRQK